MKTLLIDNYDSFTYMLKDYIEQCGAECLVVRNDEINTEKIKNSEAIIISPGPGTPAQSGNLMSVLKEFKNIPMLGVCLGHQAIGEHFGAKLQKAQTPRHGKVEMITHNENAFFLGIPSQFEATRYHSLVLENLPQELEQIAQSKTGEIMAIKHIILPIYGIQFHPESCMTKHGLTIIKNFLNIANA